MKIISWNVNGIRAIYKKGFADWLKKENADIVCIQETKADISYKALISLTFLMSLALV